MCCQAPWAIINLLLQAVLVPARFPAIVAPFTDSTRNALQNIFAFCYVWALGGTLEAASRLVPGCCMLNAMLLSSPTLSSFM